MGSVAGESLTVGALLERAESLVGPGADAAVFTRGLLSELAREFGGRRTALWQVGGPEGPVLRAVAGEDGEAPPAERLLRATAGRLVSLGDRSSEAEAESHQTGLLVASELAEGRLIALEFSPESVAISKATAVELVDVFAELQRRALLSQTLQRSDRFGRVMQLVSSLHEDLDARRVANVFATDGAATLSANRIVVARRGGRHRWHAIAATGVDRPNRRSDEVRAIERVIGDASRAAAKNGGTGDALVDPSRPHDRVEPVSIDRRWAKARHAVLIEAHEEIDGETVTLLCHELATAFANSRRADEATLYGRLKRVPRAVLRPTSIAFLSVLLAIAGWLWFGQAELKITVYGEAVPVERRRVFAVEQGVVTSVAFDDEAEVDEGTVLCTLRNEELDFEYERLSGELQAGQARLSVIEIYRDSADRERTASLSAERAELEIKVASLERQLALLQKRRDNLSIVAPIRGQIFVDDLPQEWLGRPFRRGELLGEVGQCDGPWELRLRVPETDARHVIEAFRNAQNEGESPLVSFVLETAADQSLETELQELAISANVDEYGQLSTLGIAPFELDQSHGQRRPGAGVVASIECGAYRAGYVYFRRLIEFVQRQAWF